MIPIGDDNSARVLTPYFNYLLIVINLFVFIYFQQVGINSVFTYSFSAVPAEIITGKDIVTNAEIVNDPLTGRSLSLPGLQHTPVHVWLTLITSMFMHGGIAHIGGNMLFLLVFGDNIESRLGHKRYLIFRAYPFSNSSFLCIFTITLLVFNG